MRLRKEKDKEMKATPLVIDRSAAGNQTFDIYSKLLQERMIFLTGQIDDVSADLLVAQLLYLSQQDAEKDIHFFINSPGGSVSATLAIYDTMNFIKPDVSTICNGLAASGGALLLASGVKGKRKAMPNSRIMIHQPLGGAQGDAINLQIQAKEIIKTKKHLNQLLADFTGQPLEEIENATDRDRWFDPVEGQKFGLVDEVISSIDQL
jgi:ATP-dependent Clp protease protease subunit